MSNDNEEEFKLLPIADLHTSQKPSMKYPIIILIMFCFIEFSFYFANETSVPLEAAFKSVVHSIGL